MIKLINQSDKSCQNDYLGDQMMKDQSDQTIKFN